jgi:hypothetical protein
MYALMIKHSDGGFQTVIYHDMDGAQDGFEETTIRRGEVKILGKIKKAGSPFGIGPAGHSFGCEEMEKEER